MYPHKTVALIELLRWSIYSIVISSPLRALKKWGRSTVKLSLVVKNFSSPRSIPIARPWGGWSGISTSKAIVTTTYHWVCLALDITLTCLTVNPSGMGLCKLRSTIPILGRSIVPLPIGFFLNCGYRNDLNWPHFLNRGNPNPRSRKFSQVSCNLLIVVCNTWECTFLSFGLAFLALGRLFCWRW